MTSDGLLEALHFEPDQPLVMLSSVEPCRVSTSDAVPSPASRIG